MSYKYILMSYKDKILKAINSHVFFMATISLNTKLLF